MSREEDTGKISSVEDINNRRIVKTRGAKSNEDQPEKKGNFVFKSEETPAGGLFNNKTPFDKDSNSNENTGKDTDSPKGIFKNITTNPFSCKIIYFIF